MRLSGFSQDVQCRSPACGSKCAESKGTLRVTINTVFGYMSGKECQQLHHHKGPPPPPQETLFTRLRSTVEPMMIAKDRKATLQAIQTMTVNQAVTSLRRNVVLDDRPLLINISEKELTRKERMTLALLRSGYCRLLGSYKRRISKDAIIYVVVVVIRLPRPMEGNGVTPIFRSLHNCQFHHRRLESLEHFNVLDIYIYILLSTTVSHFWTLWMPFFLLGLLFCIHFHFASSLCMCVMYLTSI